MKNEGIQVCGKHHQHILEHAEFHDQTVRILAERIDRAHRIWTTARRVDTGIGGASYLESVANAIAKEFRDAAADLGVANEVDEALTALKAARGEA